MSTEKTEVQRLRELLADAQECIDDHPCTGDDGQCLCSRYDLEDRIKDVLSQPPEDMEKAWHHAWLEERKATEELKTTLVNALRGYSVQQSIERLVAFLWETPHDVAPNYVATTVEAHNMKTGKVDTFALSLTREWGASPHEMRLKAEHERDEARAEVAALRASLACPNNDYETKTHRCIRCDSEVAHD